MFVCCHIAQDRSDVSEVAKTITEFGDEDPVGMTGNFGGKLLPGSGIVDRMVAIPDAALIPDAPKASASSGASIRSLNGVHALQWEDGSFFFGTFVDGKKHGRGSWVDAAGNFMHEGEWRDDVMHGEGVQTWADGEVHEGQFRKGRFSGRGKTAWTTRVAAPSAPAAERGIASYEGQYSGGEKHGEGRFTWPDGRTYEGQWHRGKRHGNGTYTNSLGETVVGNWKADRLQGPSEVI